MIENPKDLSNWHFSLACKVPNHKKNEVIITILVNVQNR